MSVVDLSALRHDLKQAARQAFAQVRAAHPDETFYAFALYSDDDATTVCPAANTEEACGRRVERYRSNAEFMKSLEEYGLSFNPFNYRWGTPEWAYEHDGAEHFDAASQRLNAAGEAVGSDWDEFERFKGAVYAAMVLALQELDAEGVFGVGREREGITLLCSVSDASAAAWLEEASARHLNPPAVYHAFFEQWRTNSVMAEGLAEHQAAPDGVFGAFRSALEQE